MVDLYRCYELWDLVQKCALLKAGAILEVGVWRGGPGALIANAAKKAGLNVPVYLCDTFKGVVKAGTHDTYYRGGEHADAAIADVETLLNSLCLENVRILTGIFPEESVQAVASETFRFCHIDVDVYQSAEDILEWLWPRLEVGGIVVYDDCGFDSCSGITSHVQKQATRDDRSIIYNLNGHAIVIKLR